MRSRVLLLLAVALLAGPANAQRTRWVTVWTGSAQGPYPSGNASAQPNLRFAFPDARTGARDQTFRLIVRPDLWSRQVRLRFSNAFGAVPLALDGVFAGLHQGAGAIARGTNRPVRFAGKSGVAIPAGGSVWSDAVTLPFVRNPVQAELAGRKLAVSFHVAGESGPMTWHAKALTTSYLTTPGAGAKGDSEDESAFPFTTTSWYFLDAVDAMSPAGTGAIVALGDSITDGTASTLNGDDRWPDVLARRLHRAYGSRFAVVNAGIGGNRVTGPASYTPQQPFSGGPAAGQRLERDVLSLSGVSAVIWLEGINDFAVGVDAGVEAVEEAMRQGVARIRKSLPGARVIGATLVSALGAAGGHGSPAEDARRKALNGFIRSSGLFDAVADFDAATLDPATGGLRAEFVPDSTTGGAGDHLHPNRAGYMAMGMCIDTASFGDRTK